MAPTGFVPRPNGGWLAAQLGPSGFKAEDIDVVVLSHGHPDHVAGIIEGDKPLFPNARYVIAATEYDYWAPEGKHTGELEKLAAVFRANTKQVADRFKFLKPGDDVVSGIRSIEAHGHTPGHLAFMIESQGRQILFWGDCAHHHVASLAHPEWHCVFDIDKEAAVTTRKRIYDMAATDRLARNRLSHAVPVGWLRGTHHARELSLDRAFVPAQRVADGSWRRPAPASPTSHRSRFEHHVEGRLDRLADARKAGSAQNLRKSWLDLPALPAPHPPSWPERSRHARCWWRRRSRCA